MFPLIILINLNNKYHKRENSSKRYFEIFKIQYINKNLNYNLIVCINDKNHMKVGNIRQ